MWTQDSTIDGDGTEDYRAWIKNNGTHILVQMGHQVGDKADAQFLLDKMIAGLNGESR